MPYEKGGRADKNGNRYEIRWVIYQLLKVIEEELVSVELEPIGENEDGVDMWITFPDGSREGQQCKGRNASEEKWDISSLKTKKIITKWKKQLDSSSNNKVSLVSPLAFSMLEDLIFRAKNTNLNPQEFLDYQIKESSKEFITFFKDYCSALGLNPDNINELSQIINYLSRTLYRQTPDTQYKEIVLDKIQYLFLGDKNTIYNYFENLVVEGDILGKAITNSYLRGYLQDRSVIFRNIALDKNVASRITELNEEYKETFNLINGNLLYREEFKTCNDNIEHGHSIVIHGKAGSGKSGCTLAIISYCENRKIPYLALKLDKREPPSGSSEQWGVSLGLPASITHSIDSISKKDNAVIILDQLDALRWTQAHSRDALTICSEIIREVKNLNLERNKKIRVVLACRTYDLDNDNNIRLLFTKKEESESSVEWVKVLIGLLDDEIVKNVVGETYNGLSKKLKFILKYPSNLYIWQHLDSGKTYDDISTTNELIAKWWNQLLEKCSANGVEQQGVYDAKNSIVEFIDKHGKPYVNSKMIDIANLDFLVSNGFLTLQNSNISFTHQSLLDYFIVEKMLRRYFNGENIIKIIGNKEKQTPEKRYQVQMLIQNIQEYDSKDFITVGRQILDSEDIRFYVKYVFLEILGQCTSIDPSINSFILEYCEKEKYESHVIENVISGHKIFVDLLLENGVLDKWMHDQARKNIAINLMASIRPQYSSNDVEFIKKYAFILKDDDEKLFRCFSFRIHEDTDNMFELRLEFYNHYPELAGSYLNIKEMFQNCELRTINIFSFLLNHKINKHDKNILKYEEEFLYEFSDILVKNGPQVIDKLLPYLPTDTDYYDIYRNWDGHYSYSNCLERACVGIIKKANSSIINNDPEIFLEKFKEFMSKGYIVYNEIILEGLGKLSVLYSDFVVNYIVNNFNKTIFDKTSGANDELALVKDILTKHAGACNIDLYSKLEKQIISYIDPKALDWYKQRIEYNRNGYNVYWSFWGDLQYALLQCLPPSRMSIQAKKLLPVLERRFKNVQNKYIHSNGHSGWVASPISGKEIGNNQWLRILTNEKLRHKNSSNWVEVKGGFIESSIEQFSSSLNNAVSSEPEKFIPLFLECKANIQEPYIDSFFSGIAYSEKLNNISTSLLEQLIQKYRYNYVSSRAGYICDIIARKENAEWSSEIVKIINDIAINHSNPNGAVPNVTTPKDKEMKTFQMLRDNEINCVRGKAALAISSLIWSNKELYFNFKETLTALCDDENAAVRLANLSALTPIYDLDKNWAAEKILYILEKDYRLAGFQNAKQLFFLMYPEHRQQVLSIILKCFYSDDEDLIKMGGYCVSEMFIQKGEFKEIVYDLENLSEIQIKSILEMALLYFDREENELVKDLILKYRNSKHNLEFPLSRLFFNNLINLERDKNFLVELMDSNISRRTIHAFTNYLEENSKSILEFKDIILSMSYSLLEKQEENSGDYWGVSDELSKLIVGLYDEVYELQDDNSRCILQQCLDIWDLMFENQIGSARALSKQILDK